ncbi:MAG: right-handed parallel beta-helix repeat-containing protein, partial [Planctomycetota bacterium]
MTTLARPRTINVGKGAGYDFNTIQVAIDDSNDGDTIIVRQGTYYENIHLRNKNIILTSIDPNDTSVVEGTIINANGTGSVVTFDGHENSSCLLTGFTLTNGNASFGGGIDGNYTEATITRCYIVGNRAKGGGGLHQCDGLISDCIIKDNMAQRIGAGAGSGGDGGGLYRCDGNIMRCTIANNKTSDAGGGLYYCEGKIIDCIISGNEAYDEGGGLGGLGSSWGSEIVNCVILNNKAQERGGGLYHYRGRINNCIIWSNSPDQIYKQWDSDSDPTYSCVQGGWSGTGNISINPQFVDAANGDYHLHPDSPCINVGDPDFVPMSGETDIDGEPRVMGTRVDMGVDEYTSTPSIIIGVSSKKFDFKAIKYKTNPEPQILSIWNAGYRPLTWQISEDCPWLEVYPTSGYSTGDVNEIAINVDISGLDGGTYSCELTITASEATNSPQTIEINLIIEQPVIALSKKLFEFFASEGGPDPPDQILTIRNSDGYTLNWVITYDCNWLSVEPNAGSSMGEMDEATISVDTSCLSVGEYNCDITVCDPCAVNNPQMVTIMLYIFEADPELHVPSEYKNIQMAIDVAKDGQTIIVAPGTYAGNGNRDLDFYGKAITLTSIDPQDSDVLAATVIDCNGSKDEPHRGFYFHSGEGPGSIISGFTIRNGYIYGDANDPNAYGGAIYCNSSSPSIQNCIIVDNKVHAYIGYGKKSTVCCGGGIYLLDSSAELIGCVVAGNDCIGSWGALISELDGIASGGGICCERSEVNIKTCTVYQNRVIGAEPVISRMLVYALGGGIYCGKGGTYRIEDTVIAENEVIGQEAGQLSFVTREEAMGGGIAFEKVEAALIKECTIRDNIVNGAGGELYRAVVDPEIKSGGGGLYCNSCPVDIMDCLISSNKVMCDYKTSPVPLYGGALLCVSGGDLRLQYCQIRGNNVAGLQGRILYDSGTDGGDGYGGAAYFDSKSNARFENCIIAGNRASGGEGEGGLDDIGSGGTAYGGGICWESYDDLSIRNCLIVGNIAAGGDGANATVNDGEYGGDGYAGGIYCAAFSRPTIENCTISANRVFGGKGGRGSTGGWNPGVDGTDGNTYGAGIYCEPNSTGIITNCIIWDNLGGEQIEGGEPNISFSGVQGGWKGQGNIDIDPLFVRLGYWADMNDLDAMLAPGDPNAVWVMGDYHLSQTAAGQQVTSPCVDAGSDLAENLDMAELTTRTDGAPDIDLVDMGYHYDRPSLADADGDGNIDLRDYAFLGGHWQENVDPNGHREHVGEYRSRLALRNIPIGSAVIDGDASEWIPGIWIRLDKTYYGEAADVRSAAYQVRWNPDSSTIYLFVSVTDEDRVFNNEYIYWDASDRIEVYIQAVPEGGIDFLGKYDIAQQYMIGPKPSGGYWATWALGEQIGNDVDLECAFKRVVSHMKYEVAIPL